MKEDIKINIYDQPWKNTKAVYIFNYMGNKIYSLHDGKWIEVQEGFNTTENKPTLELPTPIWQLFVDQLTDQIKPTAKAEVDVELKATKYHLEDMRKLTFESLAKEENG